MLQERRMSGMLIRLICYAAVAFIGGAAISSGYFAFISLIGVFPKLAEKVKGDRHYMLIECLLAYGAVVGNVIYLFNQNSAFTSRSGICHFVRRYIYRLSGWSSGRSVKCVPDHFKAVFRQTVYSLCDLCGGCR